MMDGREIPLNARFNLRLWNKKDLECQDEEGDDDDENDTNRKKLPE